MPPDVPVQVREGHDGAIVADGMELVLLDEPDVGDLYNFCPAEDGQVPWGPAEIHVDGQGVRAWFDDALEVRMRFTRREGEPFLRIDGVIDNRRPDHRLRLHVGLHREPSTALAGSPFELVERPLASEGSDLETASRSWPAGGLVSAGGKAVFHEGVFEYEVAGRALAVTLLRCVGTISRQTLATRPFPAGPDVPTPLAQMLGETSFALGLWPGATVDGLLANWERFALPIVSAVAHGGGTLPATGTLLELIGNAELSNVRRRDGRVEVRLWNPRRDAPAHAVVAGRDVQLGPARIETIHVPR
jgi:alpha-mannosidase